MPASHWLHRIIPDTRADMSFFTAIPWALLGNDEGGIFGERDPYHTVLGNPVTFTLWGFIRWWFRNPFHNLFFHVLRWDQGDNALILYAKDSTGSRWWFRAPQNTWHAQAPERQVYIRLLAPFFSYRGTKWEAYAGWRIKGALGFALRK